MSRLAKNTLVHHPRFGKGRVRDDDGESVVVRFEHGVEECHPDDLESIESLEDRSPDAKLDPALKVVVRVLGNCILSVNDTWGVFSRSRINLFPHQLWVCKRVLESWPTRWLVADDVGLGKTIEAGLILTPLLSSGRVKRLLILAPASLVDQWQSRMRELFDIRLSPYTASIDTTNSDYWNTHNLVVASIHTLRKDTSGRWERFLGAKPWDMVIVDEAHHMNVDEDQGRTKTFQVVELLQKHGLINSMVLFTGTPHRGKDFGFLSLLKLLRPEDFDPNQPIEVQLHKLRDVMIRNNKQRVTDMKGNPLFKPVRSRLETYTYSPAEARFYDKLTEFIATGKAYAAGLGQQDRKTAILVLITMQKLASSSVAAVRRALDNRLRRLKGARDRLNQSNSDFKRLNELIADDDPANMDEMSSLEEQIALNLGEEVNLNPKEIPALEELINAADDVARETKIQKILEVVEESFSDRSVLFFTEYKATQALLMSELLGRYGEGCVTFINGDGFVEGVKTAQGSLTTIRENRYQAARRFNCGDVRFLVSTEAAGEGIDLQENCSALVHVDLPWNPMRLHQRVGRLNRIGQTEPVEVVSLRNPATVEHRIWECLDNKLERITMAFQGAMDDPEDMRQLVIGMASPKMFTQVFADAPNEANGESLAEWFDAQTATFGGKEALDVVRNLFGNVARFDFGEVVKDIPQVDLPDLIPFLKSILTVMGKRPNQEEDLRLSFKTPQDWMNDFTITDRYHLRFSRRGATREGEDIGGVGLKIVDRAILVAVEFSETLAAVDGLDAPIVVFAIRDRFTDSGGTVKKVVAGMRSGNASEWGLIKDWELIKLLNPMAGKPRSAAFEAEEAENVEIVSLLKEAEHQLQSCIQDLDLPFRQPVIESLACLLPAKQIPLKPS